MGKREGDDAATGSNESEPKAKKSKTTDIKPEKYVPNADYPITLLQGDFCPFANRAQIAILEKEKDPNNPVLFEKIHVCYTLGPEKDPGTGWLYSLGFKTVPAIHDNTNGGKAMGESMDIVEKIDTMFSNNPLTPKDPKLQEHMKAMIEKHGSIIGPIYKLLMEQSADKQKALAKDLLEKVTEMDKDLQIFEGPYFCGNEFTIADVAFFPFYERMIVLNGHYRGFVIPEELRQVHNWYKTVKERPSVKITTSDRDEASMNTYSFEERNREKYLIEFYECFANGEVDLAKKITIESGSPGVNKYREHKKEQALEAMGKRARDDDVVEPTDKKAKTSDVVSKYVPNANYPITLLQSDFCPFANRAQIALLEKEKDPHNPTLFEKIDVCFILGPEKDRGTGWLYSLGFKTVPAIHDNTDSGKAMGESMDIVEKVDAMFPNNPLKPKDEKMLEHMNAMIEKHGANIGSLYKILLEQSPEKQKTIADTMLEEIKELDKDLKEFSGPYFCGDEFTMADIALFPFYERIMILCSHYRGFVIPKELESLYTWYKTVKERPSVKITTADRDEGSMNTYCFEEHDREKYLIECYEGYANNEIDLAKKISIESASPGVNKYHEYKKKQAAEKVKEQ